MGTFLFWSVVVIFVLYLLSRYSPKISIEKDDFKKTSWVYISPYKGCRLRALLHEDTLMLIQLYITTSSTDWIYFHSAYGEDQVQLEFLEIDSEAKIHGSGSNSEVRTHEVFALTIPLDYLEKMSTKDWNIKAYGKRRDRQFTVPQKMTKPFFEHIKAHIASSHK